VLLNILMASLNSISHVVVRRQETGEHDSIYYNNVTVQRHTVNKNWLRTTCLIHNMESVHQLANEVIQQIKC
jgi:hypothetical protein